MMVAGLVASRFAAVEGFWLFAGIGLVQTAFGGGVLVWAGIHYEDLHAPLRAGVDVVHPLGARLVGVVTVAGTAFGLVLALAVALGR